MLLSQNLQIEKKRQISTLWLHPLHHLSKQNIEIWSDSQTFLSLHLPPQPRQSSETNRWYSHTMVRIPAVDLEIEKLFHPWFTSAFFSTLVLFSIRSVLMLGSMLYKWMRLSEGCLRALLSFSFSSRYPTGFACDWVLDFKNAIVWWYVGEKGVTEGIHGRSDDVFFTLWNIGVQFLSRTTVH